LLSDAGAAARTHAAAPLLQLWMLLQSVDTTPLAVALLAPVLKVQLILASAETGS